MSIPKIDVHAHYLPADYRRALVDNGHASPDGFPLLPEWSVESHLAVMDRLGIDTAMLSITSPGMSFGNPPVDRAYWARSVNEAGAEIVREHPRRFGLLATLPLPDVDAALSELAHALDSLHADGVALESNHEGVYLADDRLAPLWQELDSRGVVVFIHPTSPACWQATSLGYPRPVVEYLLDTTRSVADLVLSGTLDRYAGARVIVPHSGSALVPLADRLAGLAGVLPLGGRGPGEIDVVATLRQLYYETGAGYPFPRQFPALLSLAEPDRLLYGTDWPFGGLPAIEAAIDGLASSPLTDRDKNDLFHGNARQLFTRLAG